MADSLDRFAQGLPDPQDIPADIVGTCAWCDEPIERGTRWYKSGGGEKVHWECLDEFMRDRLEIAEGTDE